MIAEALLSCALAMPVGSVHYEPHNSISVTQYVREYKELKTWLMNTDPKGHFIVIPSRVHAVPNGFTRMPFKWRGCLVYYRRSA